MNTRANRLFVAREAPNGPDRYLLAPTLYDALLINPSASSPTDDDILAFVYMLEMHRHPLSVTAKKLGVSRQSVLNWCQRAGVTRNVEGRKSDKKSLVLDDLCGASSVSSTQVKALAVKHGLSVTTIERYCRQSAIRIRSRASKPSDEDLIRLAEGKTWSEFAAAAGRAVSTLRTYIYARQDLARAVRAVMVRKAPMERSDA